MSKPELMQDKVLRVLQGDPNRPKRGPRKANKEFNVYVEKDGTYSVQANGRTVYTGTGGRAAAADHMRGLVASLAAKGFSSHVEYFE